MTLGGMILYRYTKARRCSIFQTAMTGKERRTLRMRLGQCIMVSVPVNYHVAM